MKRSRNRVASDRRTTDARPTQSSAAPKMPLSTFSKVDVDNIDMSEYDGFIIQGVHIGL